MLTEIIVLSIPIVPDPSATAPPWRPFTIEAPDTEEIPIEDQPEAVSTVKRSGNVSSPLGPKTEENGTSTTGLFLVGLGLGVSLVVVTFMTTVVSVILGVALFG